MEALKTYYYQGGRAVIDKDPVEVLDYPFNWRRYLEFRADTIATATIAVAPGLTQLSFASDSYTATVKLGGGALDAPLYPVACTIVTVGGRTVKRTIFIRIKAL